MQESPCCTEREPAYVLQEGIIALWKGWLPSVIGVIPYVGLNFAVYETLKDHVLKYYGKQSIQELQHCLMTHSQGMPFTAWKIV